jgi:hypothetical protein
MELCIYNISCAFGRWLTCEDHRTTASLHVYPTGTMVFLGQWLITDIVNPRGVWNQTTKPLMQFSRMSERRDYDHGLVPTLVNSKTLSPAVSSDMS